ncbi:hypothetical protein Q8A67_000453 [Cirrhinus molitorella]|uniref:Uncharacterized protein n=1 Tax=Cirrhinus molitorella TaxID=172907 RepID=A0AA88QJH8_9TELE|nr:hypothetical protein Q8A67_000453 [Cirrhinus molitorella]
MVLHGDVTLEQSTKDLDGSFLILKQFIEEENSVAKLTKWQTGFEIRRTVTARLTTTRISEGAQLAITALLVRSTVMADAEDPL